MAKLIALSRDPFEVTLDAEEGDADALVFKCLPLTANQRAKIQDMIVVEVGGDSLSGAIGSRFLYAVRHALVGIEPPMEDAEGNAVAIKRSGGAISDEILDMIPDAVIVEVGRKIIDSSALTPKQVGE